MFRLNLEGKFEQDKGQTIKRRPRPSKDPEISAALGDIYQIINELSNAVNQGFTQIYKDDASGKPGDMRCVRNEDDSYSLEARTNRGWIRSAGKVKAFDPPWTPWGLTCAYTGVGLASSADIAEAINEQVNAIREHINLLFWKIEMMIDETGYIVKERRTDRYDRVQPVVTRLIPEEPYVGDTTAPSIVSLSPENGATGVSLYADLVLTADENIFLPAMGSKMIYIRQRGSSNWQDVDVHMGDESVTFDGAELTIVGLLESLMPGVEYYVQILGGWSIGIQDAAGNAMEEINDQAGENGEERDGQPNQWIFTILEDS